jgi:CheY-like chemotaxis protein
VRAGAVDVVWKGPSSVPYLKDRVLEAAGRSVGKREVDTILSDVRDTYDDFLKRFMEAERRAIDADGSTMSAIPMAEEVRVLIVAPDTVLQQELSALAPSGFTFDVAHSGGESLDRCGRYGYQIALVAESLPDLPGSMVGRSLKAQAPDIMVVHFTAPGPSGRVDVIEQKRIVPVLDPFTETRQLADRLHELAEATRIKARERVYTQAFRERHYDFLRRYVELRHKIERALSDPK